MSGPSDFYAGRHALVTGASGFLAAHLIEALEQAGARVRTVSRGPRPANLGRDVEHVPADLRVRDSSREVMAGIDYVFHLAAIGWGLHENMRRQPELLTENLLLNTSVLDAAHRAGVRRYLFTSSSTVYPAHLEDYDEDASWDAPPHASEECFGWAKRMGEIQARTYHQHHGMPIAVVRPANPYGTHDNFDPDRSHVIPALIRRAVAREAPFVAWGSGRVIRSFVYASDVARAMLLALERAADCRPINLASNETTTVRELVELVLQLSGYGDADLRFDPTKPDGHPRKVPKVTRAAQLLGLTDYVPLREGVGRTIDWYVKQRTEFPPTLPSPARGEELEEAINA